MKYTFIRDHRDEFDIQAMCEILGASKSGFYDWLTRDHAVKQQRILELKVGIEKAFKPVVNLKPTTAIGYSREIPAELPQFSPFFHKDSFLYASGTLVL